jgi:Putative metallopeptidase
MSLVLFLLATLNINLVPVLDRWDGYFEKPPSITQADCGEENAYYFGALHLVVMCREMDAMPAVARFVLNHELGHAWSAAHGVPDSERAADELALIMSTKDEAFAAAAWFNRMADEQGDAHNPLDPHQPHRDRASTFWCLTYGLHAPTQTSSICRMYAASVLEHWTLRLGFGA